MQRYYTLHPSRSLALLYFLFCLLALISLWQLPVAMIVALVVSLVVVFIAAYRLLLDANLRLHRACVAFRLEKEGEILLVLRNGRHMSGKVSPDSMVASYLVILNIELSEQRGVRSLVILPDSMAAESFRRLRVALRWGDRTGQLAQ